MRKVLLLSIGGSVGMGMALLTSCLIAHAVPLSYTTNTNASLINPSTTLIIASGSVADDLTVNATSVVVSLSSADGGSFTLSSPQYGMTASASASGGSASVTCAGNGANITIAQSSGSATYTIAPTGSPCVAASSTVVSVGAGNGVPYIPGVGPIAASTATSTASAPSPNAQASSSTVMSASSSISATSSTSASSLLAQLNALETELAALKAQANAQGAETSSGTKVGTPVFTRDLHEGMSGTDVHALQEYLVAQNKGPAARALKAHGLTRNFASLTKAALIEFQKVVGISPASGYFGPITRNWIDAHPQ